MIKNLRVFLLTAAAALLYIVAQTVSAQALASNAARAKLSEPGASASVAAFESDSHAFTKLGGVSASSAPALVDDSAGVFSDGETAALSAAAAELSERYGCSVAIYVESSIRGADAYDYAVNIFNSRGLGYGVERSGVLLFISRSDRDMALIAHGYGNTALTDHGREVMFDRHLIPLLKDDFYYEACAEFLDTIAVYFEMAESGRPFDIDTDEALISEREKALFGVKLGATVVIPVIIALIICLFWLSKMRTAKTARQADYYIPENGFRLTRREDMFLYRTVTRRKISQNTSGGSGGGGTTIRSGGFSGGSRKF